MKSSRLALFLLGALSSSGCGGSTEIGLKAATVCEPGAVTYCVCGQNYTGEQQCQSDGLAWSSCVCDPLDSAIDTATDTAFDAGTGIDSGKDSSADSGIDSGKDSSIDTGTDGSVDSAVDTAPEAAADTGPDGTGQKDTSLDQFSDVFTDSPGAADGELPDSSTDPCSPQALGKSYIGCEYYPTISLNSQLDTVGNTLGNFVVAVSNTTTEVANVTVILGSTILKTQAIPASSFSLIYLPWSDLRTSGATAVFANSAFRLVSTRPVTVYQFNPLEFEINGGNTYTNDASLLLPVNAWGQGYIVAARNSWEQSNLPGFYSVVAAFDNTTVTVTPSTSGNIRVGAGLAANGSGSVTLNRGDVLQVLSAAGATNDVTGTRIASNKPIQVLGGHDCTNVPYNIKACDHLEEVMFPVGTLSTEYFVSAPSLPGQTQPKGFFTRVIAVEAATTLTYDPPNAAFPATITKAGDFIELDSSSAFQIKANKRVLVSQYMKGQEAGGGVGDPAMALAVPTRQFRKDYLFHSPINYTYNYVNITALTCATVNLDNTPVSGFIPIGNTGYSVARVQFSSAGNGNHRATSTGQFGISVYGYGSYTSYWYPGGLDLNEY